MPAREHQHIEWKETWRDEFLRWICGFANAEGGTLHIGRNDRGTVVGVPDARKLLVDIPNQVRDILGILVDVNLQEESGRDFIEIVVEPYPHPISYRGHYFRRSGSTLQELKGPALDRFLLRRHGRTWDGVPVPGVKLTQLSGTAIRRFRELARAGGRLETADLRLSRSTLIEKLQLIEGRYLKRAAVLLFHEDPERFITGAFVKIGFFRSESDLAYHDTVHGDLFTQTARTIDLVRTKYLKAAISYEGIHRIERFPVPEAALREAILNALVHRDYAVGAPVQIRVDERRLKIWNPCVLPDGWTVKNLLGAHASAPFNPAIANVFFRSGEIETWGRGIQRIFAACKEAGTPRPSLTLDGTGLALEFRYAPEYLKAMVVIEQVTTPVTEQVTEQVGRLVKIVGTDSRSATNLMKVLGLVHRPTFLYTSLQPSLAAGLIERTLPDKPNSRLQKYRLTTKGRTWLEQAART